MNIFTILKLKKEMCSIWTIQYLKINVNVSSFVQNVSMIRWSVSPEEHGQMSPSAREHTVIKAQDIANTLELYADN